MKIRTTLLALPYAVPVLFGILLLVALILPTDWVTKFDRTISLVFGCAIGGAVPWVNKICKGWLAGEHRFRWYEWLMFVVALAVVGGCTQLILRPQILGELADKTALMAFLAASWLCGLCLQTREKLDGQDKMAALAERVERLEAERRGLKK